MKTKKVYGNIFFEVKKPEISTVKQPRTALYLFDDQLKFNGKYDSLPLGYSAKECGEESRPIRKQIHEMKHSPAKTIFLY